MTTTPNNDEITRLMSEASAFEDAGDFSAAIGNYSLLLKGDPNNPKFLAFRGYCNYCSERFSDALSDFDKAIEIKDDTPTTLYYRAQTYEKMGKLENALLDYQTSAKLSPEVDVFINIALINKYLGRIDASESALLQATSLEPENCLVQNLLEDLKGPSGQNQ